MESLNLSNPWIIALTVVVLLFVIWFVVSELPTIRRYLRMKSM